MVWRQVKGPPGCAGHEGVCPGCCHSALPTHCAVVLRQSFQPGLSSWNWQSGLQGVPAAMTPGMLTAAAPSGSNWAVRSVPEVGGGMVEHEVVAMFRGEATGAEAQPDPAEVQAVRWLTLDELAGEIAEAPERFTPWLQIYMAKHRGVFDR